MVGKRLRELEAKIEKIDNPKGEFVILIEKSNNSETNNLDFLKMKKS